MVHAGVGDPRRVGGAAQQTFDLPLHKILQKYKQQDPPPAPQLAVPVEVVEYMMEMPATTARTQKLKDL
eukprot:9609890-Ditylum_brightwellii.AAC.1